MSFQHHEEREGIVSILNQKRSEAVRTLQEPCAFPFDEDFINAPECNSVEGVDFGRSDVNIANDKYMVIVKVRLWVNSNTHVKESR